MYLGGERVSNRNLTRETRDQRGLGSFGKDPSMQAFNPSSFIIRLRFSTATSSPATSPVTSSISESRYLREKQGTTGQSRTKKKETDQTHCLIAPTRSTSYSLLKRVASIKNSNGTFSLASLGSSRTPARSKAGSSEIILNIVPRTPVD